jgi:hypothetical protein
MDTGYKIKNKKHKILVANLEKSNYFTEKL